MRLHLQICLTVGMLSVAAATPAQAQMRFQDMDRDHDGVITRVEWRGSDRAFRNQDWNGDGVLSGDEVRPGARRQTNWSQDWNRDGIVDNRDTLISQRYRGYDMNNDGRVASSEWPGDQRLFTRLDTNRDRYVSMEEYVNGGGMRLDSQGGPAYRFSNIDINRDGWVTRNEWNMGSAEFDRLDANRDNRVSRFEFESDTASDYSFTPEQFLRVDVNRDGWLTRSEARMSNADFDRLDTNSDNRLSRFEFEVPVPYGAQTNDLYQDQSRTRAYQAGYGRGLEEGHLAGRGDAVNSHGWDLEGQTELERADSGYQHQLGSLSEYQEGYREGFRRAYREGYNAR
jgi:hypothetical protein